MKPKRPALDPFRKKFIRPRKIKNKQGKGIINRDKTMSLTQ